MGLPLDKLRAVKKVIVHGNCTDGLASAMIIQDRLPDVDLVFLQHSDDEYLDFPAEPNLLFCDIAPPEKRYQEFITADSLVLDHHKGSENIIRAFEENAVFGDEKLHPGVSGALLAFREVWLALAPEGELLRGPGETESRGNRVQHVAEMIGIRDTWQRLDPRWEEALLWHQTLSFYPKEQWLGSQHFHVGNNRSKWFLSFTTEQWQDRFDVGRMLLEKNSQAVQRCIKNAYRFESKGNRVYVFDGARCTSDVAEALDGQAEMILGFGYTFDEGKPQLRVSCRAHSHLNVAEFSKRYGGGGHTKAASFLFAQEPDGPNPYTQIEKLVREWLE
jgi:hypothetical protein